MIIGKAKKASQNIPYVFSVLPLMMMGKVKKCIAKHKHLYFAVLTLTMMGKA
jgi:hypothetical protein